MHPTKSTGIACGLLLSVAAMANAYPAAPPPQVPALQLTTQWHVGGDGGWDLLTLDPARPRLFITRGDRVEILNTRSGKIVATIPGTAGVHGVALAADLQRGFTSNGRANTVTVFDLRNYKVIGEAAVSGINPDVILYVPSSRHLLTLNGRSHDATVLDAVSLKVVATLALPGKPELAVDDGAGRVFVNIESDPGQIAVIDLKKLTVSATWPLNGCDGPTGLAFDKANKRLFSACDNQVMAVTDSTDGHAVARIAIGDHPDGAGYDAIHRLVLSSNGEGTLTVAHQDTPDSYSVLQSLATQRGARTMALDGHTGRIYLVTADFGPVPIATPDQARPRAPLLPGSFRVLVVQPVP